MTSNYLLNTYGVFIKMLIVGDIIMNKAEGFPGLKECIYLGETDGRGRKI